MKTNNANIAGNGCPECAERKSLLRPVLAPFGSDVMRHENRESDIYVIAGWECWTLASQQHKDYPGTVLCLPPGDFPQIYHWPVEARDVIIIWPEGNEADIRSLADTLMEHGALRVQIASEW